jgi:hypothetical protein
MALWGSRDSFSITGTVDLVEDSAAVVGTSTAFTTELEVGDVIINSSGAKYKVVAITDDENLTIDPAYATANASGATITGQDAPKFLAAEGATIQAIDKIFGVDTNEALAQTTDPGWVYVNSYTDANGNSRVKREVIVAASSYTADAEDVVYPDAVITINTQPSSVTANVEVANGETSFTVDASILPTGTTILYRWEEDQGAGFAELSDAGVYANTTEATLNIANTVGFDGYIYRVQISASGVSANTVSANAVLTVVGTPS